MNELIMVVLLAVYAAAMYFVTGFFIVGEEDICLLPTREKSTLEKWIVRRKIGGVRK